MPKLHLTPSFVTNPPKVNGLFDVSRGFCTNPLIMSRNHLFAMAYFLQVLWYSLSAMGAKVSCHRLSHLLSPLISNIATLLGSNAYSIRIGLPLCCILSSRIWGCFELLILLLCGYPSVGPRFSKRRTVASIDICSSSESVSHHSPNSSVYSTSHCINL